MVDEYQQHIGLDVFAQILVDEYEFEYKRPEAQFRLPQVDEYDNLHKVPLQG